MPKKCGIASIYHLALNCPVSKCLTESVKSVFSSECTIWYLSLYSSLCLIVSICLCLLVYGDMSVYLSMSIRLFYVYLSIMSIWGGIVQIKNTTTYDPPGLLRPHRPQIWGKRILKWWSLSLDTKWNYPWWLGSPRLPWHQGKFHLCLPQCWLYLFGSLAHNTVKKHNVDINIRPSVLFSEHIILKFSFILYLSKSMFGLLVVAVPYNFTTVTLTVARNFI